MILVTGPTGNAGSAVAHALVEAGQPDGVSGVSMLSGYAGLERTLADARAAGLERVVLLSNAAAPSGDTSNAVTRYHIESEAAVRESGLDWTFLQPRTFMTNPLQCAPQIRAGDVVRAPFGGVRVATVDPADIGAVAAAANVAADAVGAAALAYGSARVRSLLL
jgi:uncharacterized protein YbjT (DUF2867 family)